MLWLLALHIAALTCWCGALLYLPSLITSHGSLAAGVPGGRLKIARQLFTLVATPAALVAIIAGTALYLLNYMAVTWLAAKLTLVSGLVLCHVFTGQLIFYVANNPHGKYAAMFALALMAMSTLLIVGTLWLVLAKPF